jgi:hypothetical protein
MRNTQQLQLYREANYICILGGYYRRAQATTALTAIGGLPPLRTSANRDGRRPASKRDTYLASAVSANVPVERVHTGMCTAYSGTVLVVRQRSGSR